MFSHLSSTKEILPGIARMGLTHCPLESSFMLVWFNLTWSALIWTSVETNRHSSWRLPTLLYTHLFHLVIIWGYFKSWWASLFWGEVFFMTGRTWCTIKKLWMGFKNIYCHQNRGRLLTAFSCTFWSVLVCFLFCPWSPGSMTLFLDLSSFFF